MQTHAIRARTAVIAIIAALSLALILTAGDPVSRGKQIFDKQCAKCHALDENRQGPQMRGVYGRISGTVPNFNYSDALKNAHISWNDETLDKWLTEPDKFIPDNFMAFHLPGRDDRKAVISYLKTFSDK